MNKNIRNIFVDNIYKKIDESKFPNDLIGLYLFGFHAYSPLIFYIIIIYGLIYNKIYLVKFVLIIWLTILILWIYFDGCIFTLLEFKLMKTTYTQYDIFYYLFNIHDYSKEEKKLLSYKVNKILISTILFCLIYLFIYY